MDCIYYALKCSFDETWMHQTSNVPDNSCHIFRAFRTNKKHGGVALYIQDILKAN